MPRDHFDVLGLERAYHLERPELEARYLALSKQTHPDRFAKALPRERLAAVVRNTELNDAYKVLKDDLKRAEYLLKLEGIDIGEEKPKAIADGGARFEVDRELLMTILELREQLAEARLDGDDATVARLADDVRGRRDQALAAVDRGFTAWEAGERAALPAVAQALVALRYYRRFFDEVDAHHEAKET